MTETDVQKLRRRAAELRNIRSRFEPHWKLLDEHLQVRRARWTLSDLNSGRQINDTIINNTPVRASRVAISGMMAALTSAARVWYLLAPPDPELAEYAPVREYLHICQERMRWVFAKSNWYRALGDGVYADLIVFGTNATLVEDDARNIVRFTSLPLGEYSLAVGESGKVDTLTRDIPMTVRQVVQRFCSDGDLTRLSPTARNAWDRRAYEAVIEVVHCIYPNGDYDPRQYDRRGKRFSSDWFEKAAANEDTFLRRAGYEEFPALCPRWSVRQGEAYGRSPGMEVLGDCMALQHREIQGATLLDKIVEPPMKASEGMRSLKQSLMPGDTTYIPYGVGHVFEPAIQVSPQALPATREDVLRIEERIDRGLFADLWLRMLDDDRRTPPTATEVEAIRQEAMLQLGPALENLEDELLRPAVDRVFAIMARRGLLPPAPPELQGAELKVEFQSVMHQAQRMVSLSGIRTLYQELGQVAALRPEVLDKLDADKIADEIAMVLGTKPDLLLSENEAVKIRQDRAVRQQAMAQGQAMLAAAKGAKDLGTASVTPDTALGAVLGQLSPAAAAAGAPGVTGT